MITIFIRRVVEGIVDEEGDGRVLIYGNVVGVNDISTTPAKIDLVLVVSHVELSITWEGINYFG